MSALEIPAAPFRRRIGLLVRVVREANRKLAIVIASTLVLSSIAGAMQSLALKWLVNSAIDRRFSFAVVAAIVGGIGAGLLGSAGRAMSDTELVVTNQVGLIIDRRTLELTAGMPGIEHLERPEYLDQIALIRTGGASLMRAVFALTGAASLVISMGTGLWLLAAVHPLLLLVPVFAVPTAILVPRSDRYVDAANSAAAERQRAATQLHRLFLRPAAAMELRVFGCDARLDRRSDELWREVADVQLRGAVRSAAVACIGWTTLTAGYVFALLFTAHEAVEGRASVGDIVLVSQLALMIRGNVTQTANAARQAAAALRTTDRFLWLEDLAAAHSARYDGRVSPPDALHEGIRLDAVSFTYPGTTEPVLHGIDVLLPAGATVAIVGENGAGKTTLVKLLAGMYRPTSGRVLVDGTDLVDLDIAAWRRRMGGTFQDFVRLETSARHTVGVGDPPAMNDDEAVRRAMDRGGGAAVVARLADGLDSHLGKSYLDGEELSGGQWQRLAIARGMMREQPLCLVLDEPTAALDPAAEHDLYEEYGRTARTIGRAGSVTVLISHRFSSVRMADLIVVVDRGTVAEVGTHHALLASEGLYARMYRQQAAAYS
jgi:ATP-binding cassette subfamily B protein